MTVVTQSDCEVVQYRPSCSSATLNSVLDVLNRWSGRCEDHHSNKRRHTRGVYEAKVLAAISTEKLDNFPIPSGRRLTFEVWARNLSRDGISLVAAPYFVPPTISDETPRLNAAQVIQPGRTIELRLELPGQKQMWLEGQVVRVRTVHDGFVECGVRFTRRREADEPSDPS